MREGVCISLPLLMLLASVCGCVAWWDEGHMLVGEVARQSLPKEMVESLESYLAEWESDYEDMSTISKCATWPDHVKCTVINNSYCQRLVPTRLKYFGNWHYVNQVYNPHEIPLSVKDSVQLPDTGAVWALNKFYLSLQSQVAPLESLVVDGVLTDPRGASASSFWSILPDALSWARDMIKCGWAHVYGQGNDVPAAVVENVCKQQESSSVIGVKPQARAKNNVTNAFAVNMALRMFIHILGDIHQPLHSITLFNDRFPHGDKGGGGIHVSAGDKEGSLHQLWDSGAWTLATAWPAMSDENLATVGADLIKEFPPESFGNRLSGKLSGTDFQAIVEESYNIAVVNVYNEIDMPGNASTFFPSDKYLSNAKHLSLQQIALGGYRLAYALEQLYSKKGDEKASPSSEEDYVFDEA